MNDMRTQLYSLRTPFMSDILGGDIMQVSGFDNAMVAAGAAGDAGVHNMQPLHPTSASIQNRTMSTPVVGTKRKAHVIDLTED